MKMKNDYCSEITYFFAFLKNLPIELRLIWTIYIFIANLQDFLPAINFYCPW
jgi:hypothetical protein